MCGDTLESYSLYIPNCSVSKMTQVNLQFLSVKVIFVEIFVQFEWTLVFFTKYGHMYVQGFRK